MPDKRQIELAKVLFSQGKNKSQIARQLSTSQRTVGRWLEYDDDPEFAEELAEIRLANQSKFINDAWRIIHKGLEVADVRIDDPKTSAKDAITSSAILIDKVHMMETFGAHKVEEVASVRFVFQVPEVIDAGNTGSTLAEPGDVPQLPGEIQGDDRGEGFGENLQLMPGSDQTESGEPRDPGGDSSLDV